MRFPNAYKGIKRIYLGEIMGLIATALTVVSSAAVMAFGLNDPVPDGAPREGTLAIAAVLAAVLLAVIVLALAALVVHLTGIISARKDEAHFSTALITMLSTLVFSFAASFLTKNNPEIRRWFTLGGMLCGMFTSFFSLSGIASLAKEMADGTMKAMAEKGRVIACAAFVISMSEGLAGAFLRDSTVASLLEIIGYVASIVFALYYITVLARAKKMLAA